MIDSRDRIVLRTHGWPAITYDATRKATVDLFDASQRTGRRRVPIKVGISNGTRTQLLEGLNQGDRVVLPS